MKPRKSAHKKRQKDLFQVELTKIIDSTHSLVKLAKIIYWKRSEEVFGSTYCPDNGRPAISTRLMVALHFLKYTHNLSDEEVVAAWVENPYWQYFSGMKYFEHKMPMSMIALIELMMIGVMEPFQKAQKRFQTTPSN